MPWTVARSDRAEKSLKGIPAGERIRIVAALDTMRSDHLLGDVKKLKGMGAFRRRVGSYRIIFDLDFKMRVVRILDVLRRTTTTDR